MRNKKRRRSKKKKFLLRRRTSLYCNSIIGREKKRRLDWTGPRSTFYKEVNRRQEEEEEEEEEAEEGEEEEEDEDDELRGHNRIHRILLKKTAEGKNRPK